MEWGWKVMKVGPLLSYEEPMIHRYSSKSRNTEINSSLFPEII